jgi:hypothetical protein
MFTVTFGECMTGGWVVTVWYVTPRIGPSGLPNTLAYMTPVHETLRSAYRDADLWMAAQ